MTRAEIIAHARAAGAAGVPWMTYTCDDALTDAIADLVDELEWLIPDVEVAWREGAREWRRSRGWVERWTTAPDDYDGAETEEIERGPGLDPRYPVVRRVLIAPGAVAWQEARYRSGLHGCAERDPRVEAAEIEARVARLAEARAQDERDRAAGLAWLAALTDDEVEAIEGEDWDRRRLTAADVRAERAARARARKLAADREAWARLAPLVPEGSHVVDPGAPGRWSRWGSIPPRPSRVWYAVEVRRGYGENADDPEAAEVYSGRELVGDLATVAERVAAAGEYRIATDADVPPRAVLDRIGHDHLADVRFALVGDRTFWGRRWSDEVYDERGRKVRAGKTRDLALSFLRGLDK